MTPEERVNQEVWWVLQRIKEEGLIAGDKIFFYDTTTSLIAPGVPTRDRERAIIQNKLAQEERAIKITRESAPDWRGTVSGFYLKILQPKFDEVYSYYQGLSKNENKISKTIINTDKGIQYIEPKINNTPVKIVISDLKSMYQEIEHEQDRVQFFIKIAQYGKYILENQSTINALSPLYQEAQDDTNTYKDAWKEFIDIWKEYSKDLIEKAEQAGIKDNPNDPLAQEIGNIKLRLLNEDALVIESDLENYFLPYQTLIWKFGKINKYDLIIPKHLDFEDNSVVLQPLYSKARDAWDIFKYSREAKVWWAHYQICRVAAGILSLSITKDYFKRNRVIDIFYKFEFDEIAKGNVNRSPIVLFPDRFLVWVKRLHDYLIPRLENLAEKGLETKDVVKFVTPKFQITFDQRTGKITLQDKEVSIPKNTDQFDLCNTIFEDQQSKEKEWSWDEMLEKWGSNYDDKDAWRKVYNAAREINQKVAAKTATEDFLLVTTQTTQLNPKYL